MERNRKRKDRAEQGKDVIMIVKLTGCGLILLAGILTSFYLLRPLSHKIRLLEEGEYLFRLMESGIRYHKEVLPELFYQLGKKAKTPWQIFFCRCMSG